MTPNYSQRELNQNKIMDKVIKVGAWIAIIVFICWFIDIVDAKGYDRGYKDGIANHVIGVVTAPCEQYLKTSGWTFEDTQLRLTGCTPTMTSHFENPPQEISVLVEKKRCDELGGEFKILYWGKVLGAGNYSVDQTIDFMKNGYTLTCTSPAKELFNHKLQ